MIMNPNTRLTTLILTAGMLATLLAACQQNRNVHPTASVHPTVSAASAAQIADMTRGYKLAKWGSNVSVVYADGQLQYRANGLPNHPRPAEYALPNEGIMRPTAATSHAGADPSVAQNYEFKIPLNPRRAVSPTTTSLGVANTLGSATVSLGEIIDNCRAIAEATDLPVNADLENCGAHEPKAASQAIRLAAEAGCVGGSIESSER